MGEQMPHALAMLQHADSAFPSGTISFSWGLEALVNRGAVTNADNLAAFLSAQFNGRWANIDRVMLLHAHAAKGDLDRVANLDALLDAQSLAAEQRMGSRRMGSAFLGIHVKLATPMAATLRDLVAEGRIWGHAPIVQGVIWQALGFSDDQSQAMAAHGLCSAVLSSAIRLSVIGHIDAQKIHTQILSEIGRILDSDVCHPEDAHGFAPQIEIASMLHETDQMRLFVN